MTYKIHGVGSVFGPEWRTYNGSAHRPMDTAKLYDWMLSMEGANNSMVDKTILQDTEIRMLKDKHDELRGQVEKLQAFMNWVGMHHSQVIREYKLVQDTKKRLGADEPVQS
jgi:hypothetical protein